MLNRRVQPDIIDAADFNLHLKPLECFTLDNGIQVYALRAPEQEVAFAEWVFYAGNAYEQENMTAACVNYLLKNGTKNKTAFEINEHFEFYGAYLNRNCYNETASIKLHSLSKHLPELLPLVNELFTESVFPEQELAIYQQNQKQGLEVSLKKCDFVANRLIDKFLFGFSHPYGRYASVTDYDKLERSNLIRFYDKYYINGKCIIFIAGNLPHNIEALLNRNFGALLCNKQAGIINYNNNPEKTKEHFIVNDENGVQGAIRIARNFFSRHHPDFMKVQVLNNILGGYFGSRLMSNIREDKGYTYGIHSYLQNHIHESAWMIATEAGRDVCEATAEEVFKEMKRLREEPVGKEELHLVRNYMIGSILGDLDGPFQTISRWKTYIINNLAEDYFNKSIHTIKKITALELQELAIKYLQPEAFYKLTVI
ncbi:M16 family metallopeptidase [Parafilimonas sp.]|uniref:M16 family metallopeptidase n=1 Tax=Parafilimonas sp. TaxID=1969739 RepID=UPI0039E337B1